MLGASAGEQGVKKAMVLLKTEDLFHLVALEDLLKTEDSTNED